MENPYTINVHCDGAMNYDSKQTGGNGFFIEFPESIILSSISKTLRNDGQGIHRLEMISVIEAMEELILISKKTSLRNASGVIIYTDRLSITDEAVSPYKIPEYIKNKWKTHEGKAVKNKDLLEEIHKRRRKLAELVGGRIEIKYKKEKNNKIADKLSRIGRDGNNKGKISFAKKNMRVSPRKFDGPEVEYSSLNPRDIIKANLYAWQPVQNQCEINIEFLEGKYLGRKMKVHIPLSEKNKIHRRHSYEIELIEVFKHHATAIFLREVV